MNPTPSERIDEIAFDLNSISTILGFALDKLSESDTYGRTDTEDGAMMCNVGQVLIDTCARLGKYRDKLHAIGSEVKNLASGGAG